MSDYEDLGSDSNDDDYKPSDGEAVSEEEGSGDEEDVDALQKDAGENVSVSKKRKDKNNAEKTFSKKQKLQNSDKKEDGLEMDSLAKEQENDKQKKKEVEEKKRADDLWSSFMSDIPTKAKPKPSSTGLGSISNSAKSSNGVKSSLTPSKSLEKPNISSTSRKSEKITITKEYEFAGETIKVTEQVDINSKEAKAELSKKSYCSLEVKSDSQKDDSPSSDCLSLNSPSQRSNQRMSSGGGLGSVLSKMNKKNTISTLNKSKLDWETFKSEEGISEELQKHNKGKDGYLERQDFLARVDFNQFEIEKNLRLSKSFKR